MVKKSFAFILLMAGLLVGLSGSKAFASSKAERLFQEAMVKESGERDPEAALKLYQEVLDQSGSNERLAAKARLHMGACLERLGKPKDAEAIYQEITKNSNAAIADTAQSAQANLERLQAQEKKDQEEAARSKPMVLVKEFKDSGFSVFGGPSYISGSGPGVAVSGRYRISAKDRPFALFGELGGIYPIGDTTVDETSSPYSPNNDQATLKQGMQLHLGFVAELPHGKQKHTVPEFGIGAARTNSKVEYTSTGTGETDETVWSPYITGGVRLRADKQISVLLSTTYIANPYRKAININDPAHTQTFDFPSGSWALSAQVYFKIGKAVTVMRSQP